LGPQRRRLIAVLVGLALAILGLGLGSIPTGAFQSTGDGSWRWQNPLPEGNLIIDMSCVSGTTCTAIERVGGGVLHSTDSGATWTWAHSPASILSGVSCLSASTCYGVGDGGAIVKTTDGASWTSLSSGTTALLSDISCPADGTCLVVGSFTNLATTNGGATWVTQSGGGGNSISCPTTMVCYAASSSGITGTTDGGATWTVQNTGSPNEYWISVGCPSISTCFAVSGQGNIFKTADSGTTWQKVASAYNFFYSISCPSTSVCFAVTGGSIVSTMDGGTTWRSTADYTRNLLTISCGITSVCYTGGLSNVVLRTGDSGTTWTQLRPTGSRQLLRGVSCPVTGTCFSVGDATTILATTDGGQTWSAQTAPANLSMYSISCPSATTCIAGATTGQVIKTTNGGATWVQQGTISNVNLRSISCPSLSVCFGVGGSDTIIRATTDGGTTWTAQPSNATQALLGVGCVSTMNCHAVGRAGTIAVTTNGTTWSLQPSGVTDDLTAVSCPSTTSCYAVGSTGSFGSSHGDVLATHNGGSSWSAQDAGLTVYPVALSCSSELVCIAVGAEHGSQLGGITTILATTDGATWTHQAAGSDVSLTGVSCPSACWAVGTGGAILTGPAGIIDPTRSSAVANPPFVPANGSSTSAVTVTVKDTAGNPVAMKPVSLAKIAGPGAPSIAPATATTNSAGQAVFTVASATVGRDTFRASQGTTPVATVDITFTGTLRAVLPALANAAYGGYTSSISVQNLGTTSATLAIEYFDQDGHFIGSGDVTSGLPSHASWTVRQDNGNSFMSGAAGWARNAGSGLIFSDQPVAAFVNEFAPGNGSDATSYTSIASPSGTGPTLFAPAIASNAYGGYTTGIGLINLSAAAADVTITYRNLAGVVVLAQTLGGVPAGAYRGVYSGDSGSPTDAKLPANFAGTATITSSTGQPLAAVVNEVGPGGQFSSYDAVPAGSTTLQAPVALNNAFGGYYTGIGVQNTTGTAGTVTLKYFDSAGAATTKMFPIAPNGYVGIYQGSPTDGPAPGPYTAQITSGVAIAAIVNEVAPAGTSRAQQSTSYNTFSGGAATANLALVENAGSDGWSTGLGIMNTGTAATSVTVTYYDAATGTAVGTAQTNSALQPNAFWPVYQPDAGLPVGQRATAVVTTGIGGTVAVICNETNAISFMSYDAQ
jgi:photosystem II stability/assembly factor-like uncharacterized protein